MKMLLCVAVILLFDVPSICADCQTNCTAMGGTWSPTTGSCLKMSSTKGPWSNGYTYCASQAPTGLRGRLAYLPTNDSFTLARGFAISGGAWIGMHASVTNSTTWSQWYWYDDPTTILSSITFLPSGSDIHYIGADCVNVYLSSGTPGFQDQYCYTSQFYMCEFVCGSTTTTTSTSAAISTSSAACAACNLYPGYDHSGFDIDQVTTTSAEDCCAACRSLPGCVAFSWGSSGAQANYCWRKSGTGALAVYNARIAGYVSSIAIVQFSLVPH